MIAFSGILNKRALPRKLRLGALLLFICLLSAFQENQPLTQTTVLYDGSLGGTPDTQGFSYLALATGATQTFSDGVTRLDTTAVQEDKAGYFAKEPPSLDRQLGYTLQLTIQINEESHTTPHRAGFSVIMLSEDLQGIELGFWNNEIWAQEGGTSALFTHAEGVSYDTTADLIDYELQIAGDSYTLSANGAAILSGALRDYTAFEGALDPYETPNLLFMGDNTSSAKVNGDIAYAALQTTAPATSTPTATAEATSTQETTPTLTPTSTLTPTLPPTLTPPASLTPTPEPARPYNWWFPMTADYPSHK